MFVFMFSILFYLHFLEIASTLLCIPPPLRNVFVFPCSSLFSLRLLEITPYFSFFFLGTCSFSHAAVYFLCTLSLSPLLPFRHFTNAPSVSLTMRLRLILWLFHKSVCDVKLFFLPDNISTPSFTTAPKYSVVLCDRVVVHAGGSMSSGHYYAYVRSSSGIWAQMDDTGVSKVRTWVSINGGRCFLV